MKNNNATRIETSRVHFYRQYISTARNTDGGKRTAARCAAGANIKGNRSVRIITDQAYLPADIINSRSPRVTIIYDGRSAVRGRNELYLDGRDVRCEMKLAARRPII